MRLELQPRALGQDANQGWIGGWKVGDVLKWIFIGGRPIGLRRGRLI